MMRTQMGSMLFATALAAITAGDAAAQVTGPSTATEPYVLPSTSGVTTVSVLTTGDSVGGYRMVGVPDGSGAWNETDDTFNLVVNHELESNRGVVRAHGAIGSFVSRWLIDRDTLQVLSGRDNMTSPSDMHVWNGSGYTAGAAAIDRLCSADLSPKNAYFVNGKLGTAHRIFMSGEEDFPPFEPDHTRMFAHVVTGPEKNSTYQLPRMGRAGFENALASPYQQAKTIVMLSDDAGRETNLTIATACRLLGQTGCFDPPSEQYIYIGTKQGSGSTIERAGLTNGKLYGLQVVLADGTIVSGESPANVFGSVGYLPSARFQLVELGDHGDVSNLTGVQQQDEAITRQVTQFIRIEDGAWDPRTGTDYYFITTGRITTNPATWRPSRLWHVTFDDITLPELGGTIEVVLSSSFNADNVNDPGYQMFDNMAIDVNGRAILQEDVGNNARLGRLYAYGLDSGTLVEVARHNPRFFSGTAATNPDFQTLDEESSAVIDASGILGDGWYFLMAQSHRASPDPELVEGGQMVAMYVDPAIAQ